MSIEIQALVWQHSRASGSALLLLLKLADYSNAHGVAFPSIKTLAKMLRMSERSTQNALKKLQSLDEIRVLRNAGPRGCNLYRVQVLADARSGGVNPASEMKHSSAEGEAADIAEVKPAAPEPSLTVNEPLKEERSWVRNVRTKKGGMTLEQRRAYCDANGLDVVPSDAPVMRYAANARIPREFIFLAWRVFLHRYTVEQPDKIYPDWAQTFERAVRANWLNLWRYDQRSNEYFLTTPGVQAQLEQREDA